MVPRLLPPLAAPVLLAALLLACGCLGGSTPSPGGTANVTPTLSTPAGTTTTLPDQMALVARAASFAREHGREEAIDAFLDPAGLFSTGGVAVYARDYNGSVLASAPGASSGGTSGLEATDAFGVPFVHNMGETARYGAGLVSHASPNQNGTVEPAIEAVEDVDGTYYVGAGVFASGAGLYTPAVPNATGEQPDVDVLEAFVLKAVAVARERGREAALEAFDDPAGAFSRGPLTVTALDFNGTVLAGASLAPGATRPGTNLLNYHDPDGVAVVRGMRDLARSGGGLLYSVAPISVMGREVMVPRINYAAPVDGDVWLCAGIVDPAYAGAARGDLSALPVRNETRTRLFDLVNRAVGYAREHGKEGTLEAINDPAGPFVEGDLFVWAESTDGTILADPFWKSALGQNFINYTDLYGLETTRTGIAAMQNGTGFSHALFPDTAANGTAWVPKLVYQAPVDEGWWIGSGIYGVEVR